MPETMNAAETPVLAEPVRASMAERGAAYLIDVIPALLLALVALIPLVGHILAGLLLGFYWLYRDAMKFSLGKMALGLAVVRKDGEPASRHALVRRNLPFAIAGFITAFPILGIVLGPITKFVAFATTVLLLATEGNSLGDKWADTTVVKRR